MWPKDLRETTAGQYAPVLALSLTRNRLAGINELAPKLASVISSLPTCSVFTPATAHLPQSSYNPHAGDISSSPFSAACKTGRDWIWSHYPGESNAYPPDVISASMRTALPFFFLHTCALAFRKLLRFRFCSRIVCVICAIPLYLYVFLLWRQRIISLPTIFVFQSAEINGQTRTSFLQQTLVCLFLVFGGKVKHSFPCNFIRLYFYLKQDICQSVVSFCVQKETFFLFLFILNHFIFPFIC